MDPILSKIKTLMSICRCGSGDWTLNMASSFIQSVKQGIHSFCPATSSSSLTKRNFGAQQANKNGLLAVDSAEASELLYTYQYIYGQPPPPLGQVVNILEDDSSTGQQYRKDGQSRMMNQNGKKGSMAKGGTPTLGDGGPQTESSQVLFSLETLIITVFF